MTALAFVVTGAGQVQGAAIVALAAARPGDEVIVALPPPAARDMALLRDAAAGRAVAWFGPENPDSRPPPGTVAVRPLALGAACPPGTSANLALARVQAEGVVWLPGGGSAELAEVGGLRRELARGADLVFGPHGQMALARDLLRSAVLPLPETAPGIEGAAFFWRALHAARRVAGPVPPVPPVLQFGPPPDPDPPGALFALFDPLEAIVDAAGGGEEARARARGWLLSRVAHHLAELPVGEFWSYAEAARRTVDAGGTAHWRHDPQPAAQALALLAGVPLWQAVAAWQGARRAGRMPGSPDAADIARAQALWRRFRVSGCPG